MPKHLTVWITTNCGKKTFYETKNKEFRGEKKRSLSFFPPWQFLNPISPSRAPDTSLLLMDPRLLISLHRNWLSHPHIQFSSIQSLSWVRLFATPGPQHAGLPVHHQLPEFTETHVHWVSDAIQPSHSLSSPSLPAFNLSQYQGFFQWVSSSHQVAKALECQLQHQSFQWIFRTDFLQDGLVESPCSPRDSQEQLYPILCTP